MNDEAHIQELPRCYEQRRGSRVMAKPTGSIGLSRSARFFRLTGRLSATGYLQRLDDRVAPRNRFFSGRLAGPVRAGVPQPRSQEEPDCLILDDYLIDEPDRTSLHRVRGDLMRDVSITEGDLVAVKHNTPTNAGGIVLAVVDGELTVKTVSLCSNGKHYLKPENPDYAPIHPTTSLEILGVVVSVMRQVRR